MRTYELLDTNGRVYAFEVNNSGLGRRGVCRVVDTIPGAHIVRKPKIFSWFREEYFCEFEVEGKTFVAWEPYGDNSRFWIGPEPPRWLPQTQAVRDAFEAVPTSRVLRWLGFLLGAFMVAVGLKMISNAPSGTDMLLVLPGLIFGAYFITFGLTGQRTFWAYRRRK
jgi:hypothetical protein